MMTNIKAYCIICNELCQKDICDSCNLKKVDIIEELERKDAK